MKLLAKANTTYKAMALIGILLLGAASTPVRADDGEGAGRGFLKIVEDVLPNIPMPDKFRSAGGEKVIGQIFSILLTEIKERQVRTEPEVRKAMVEEGRPVSDEPMVEIQAVHCIQAETTAGGNVTLVTRYIALGEKKLNPLKGRVDMLRENRQVKSGTLAIKPKNLSTGEQEFEATFQVPESQLPGSYELRVTLENHSAVDTAFVNLVVHEAP